MRINHSTPFLLHSVNLMILSVEFSCCFVFLPNALLPIVRVFILLCCKCLCMYSTLDLLLCKEETITTSN